MLPFLWSAIPSPARVWRLVQHHVRCVGVDEAPVRPKLQRELQHARALLTGGAGSNNGGSGLRPARRTVCRRDRRARGRECPRASPRARILYVLQPTGSLGIIKCGAQLLEKEGVSDGERRWRQARSWHTSVLGGRLHQPQWVLHGVVVLYQVGGESGCESTLKEEMLTEFVSTFCNSDAKDIL